MNSCIGKGKGTVECMHNEIWIHARKGLDQESITGKYRNRKLLVYNYIYI